MTRLDRRALFASGSAAALLAAVGASAAASPVRGGHLRVALSGGDRAEHWQDVPGGRFLQAARNAVFETLTDLAPDGTLQPGLATSWRTENGGQVWTLGLRSGVTFHDGAEMRAEDVAASMQAHPACAEACVIERGMVRAVLHQADPDFPLRLADGTLPIFTAKELAAGARPVIGSGPYRIKRFDAGRGFLGQRVSGHWRDGVAGWFETVELVAVSDEAVRAEAVRDGHVDAADLTAAHDLADNRDVRLLTDADGLVHGAVRGTIEFGARTGPAPLDALRFATRWWTQT